MSLVLPLLLFIPLAGFTATLAAGSTLRRARAIALAFSVADTVLAGVMLLSFLVSWFDPVLGARTPYVSPQGPFPLYYVERYPWVPPLGMNFIVGVDGLSAPLVFLTPLLTTLAIAFSWNKDARPRQFFALLILMEFSITGVFLALDFFLFAVFWEIVLIPMFFLIGIWGGPNRQYASIKFFVYTHVGFVIMLLSIFALYWNTSAALNGAVYGQTGATFDMTVFLIGATLPAGGYLAYVPLALQIPVFVAFFFGFGVKLPMVPFHTWLPDAHVEAPTAGSVILAGLMLKMGGYGVFRIGLGMLPGAAANLWWVLAIFGTVSMVYASFVCLAQTDLKRLIAYSSVGHMGFVLLGASSLNSIGIAGGIFQLFNHGLITAVLFMLAGTIKHSAGTRDISVLTGLGRRMPQFSLVLVIGFLASVGLPGLNSFWSEFLVFTGFYSGTAPGLDAARKLVVIPLVSIAITAAYYLWTLHKVVLGEPDPKLAPLHDLNRQERVSYAILLGLILFVGLFPLPFLGMISDYSGSIARLVGG